MSINKVWVPSKSHAWELAEIVKATDEEISFKTSEGVSTLPKTKTHRTDPTHFEDTNDLCTMNHLHEAPLLDVLRRRFHSQSIYTTTGDVLISVNPYRVIPGLYDNMVAYLDVPEDGDIDPSSSKPHVYKIANYALQEMLCGKKTESTVSSYRNQSIVVSGESGAGKTEASKHVMSFLIAADQEVNTTSEEETELAQKIGAAVKRVLLESNIIFESFGNAKTVRNDNSSRFGKYIKLQYSDEKRIISAFTETFLLEKSRLVNISTNERNYHVFYQLLLGNKDAALAAKLKLSAAENFKMLCDSAGTAYKSSEDQHFGDLSHALSTLGCTEVELNHLWSVLACILHMGNFTTAPSGDEKGSVKITSPSMDLAALTALLGVSEEFFESRLTTQRVKVSTRSSVTIKVMKAIDVMNNINALIKWMYSCTFAWLVKKINHAHCSVASDLEDVHAVNFIGILDIFGFEILQTNSFEQLCINFTNERLQQQFNEYVFDREQEIYRAEGLDWTTICYKDNQHVIDLIGKKPTGILNILEEQGMLNRGAADEGALLSSFTQAHDKKSAAYEKSRFTNDGKFIIKHFAGDVTYTITGFLEKNNDSLQEDLMELMVGSSDPFIQNAIVSVGLDHPSTPDSPGFIDFIDPDMIVASAGNLSAAPVRSGDATAAKKADRKAAAGRRQSLMTDGGAKKLATSVTVSFQFRSQLDILLLTLRATSPHYIKCIKPNSLKVAEVFDSAMVLEQLRYSGALEVVRIRQEGFPIAMPFTVFYETFEILNFKRGWSSAASCTTADAKEYSRILASEVLTSSEFQVGFTKVFMRSLAYENMHKHFGVFLGQKLRKFQALVRKRYAVRAYTSYRKGLIVVQAVVRMKLRLKKYRLQMAEVFAARAKEQERLKELARLAQLALEESERQAHLAAVEAKRLAQLALEKRIADLHSESVAGNLAAVKALLQANPADYLVRNEHRHHCTVFQSAVLSGNLDLLKYLNPAVDDLNIKDDQGNVAVHYAAQSSASNKVDVFRLLSSVMEAEYQTKFVNVRPPCDGAGVASADTRRVSLCAGIVRSESTMEVSASLLANGNTATGAANGTVLRAGWLSKRGEGPTWRKRWVVLTNESLMYFRNDKDKVQRDAISFATRNDITIDRSPGKPTAIDIFIGQSSVKKSRSRISMMADTEQEIQAWMNLLKASAGVESPPLRKSSPVDVLNTVSPALRQAMFCLLNKNKESVVDLIGKSGGDKNENMIAAAWVIDNGCPLNEVKLKEAFGHWKKTSDKFNAAPPRLRGFHYLSLGFLKHTINSRQHAILDAGQISLKVSVYNNNNLLVENAQTSRVPAIQSDPSTGAQILLWLDTFHLQVPLDNIGDGSYVVVEVVQGASTTGWFSYVVDRATLNTKVTKFTVNAPPVVLSANAAGVTAAPSQSVLEVEAIVSKRTGKETKMFN